MRRDFPLSLGGLGGEEEEGYDPETVWNFLTCRYFGNSSSEIDLAVV